MRLLGDAPRAMLLLVTKQTAQLLEEALKLDPAGRAELVSELIASLDSGSDKDVEAAWAFEIEERAARARAGVDPGEPWPEIRDRLERDLRSR
jgi:putative addiction module component (TIGR02574 family)